MTDEFVKNISEKRYHLDKHYLDEPVMYGDVSLIQIGRLHCTAHTVIGMHLHRNWFELTVVTDGAGTVTTGDSETAVTRGDIYLSFPGDFHGIRTDFQAPLKYDFFAFYTEEPLLHDRLEAIMQDRQGGDQRIIRDERIQVLLENAIAEISRPTELSNEILEAIFKQILLYLIRDFQTEDTLKKEKIGTPQDLCYQIMHYLDTHIYTMNGLYELAEAMNYNYSYLSDHFKRITRETLQEYYQGRRLRAAQLLLQEEKLKLGEIANLLRYSSIYAFSRAFKDKFGEAPSEYRKRAQQNL